MQIKIYSEFIRTFYLVSLLKHVAHSHDTFYDVGYL